MTIQHARPLSRRRFLGEVTIAGTAGLLGVRPGPVAAEPPPPETTRIRLIQFGSNVSGTPVSLLTRCCGPRGSPTCSGCEATSIAVSKLLAAGERRSRHELYRPEHHGA